MPIKVLDPQTVSRIAAGEVVERPASVVKELVENSLDAGASQISVEVKGGGAALIRVTDNGCGIIADEVELAFDRHATSKLESADDLDSISSLGFRGEALPSIASVAEVDIITCAAGEKMGTQLSLSGGVVTGRGVKARSQGTTVTVRNLFRKIPARLRFLKSISTENSHIANVVSQYALAYPEVKFSLAVDGRQTLGTPGSGKITDSLIEVYGVDVAGKMLELKSDDTSPLKITGMVGFPSISRAGRGYLSFFVNRRWVLSRLLAKAVEEGYHGLLMTGKHPVAVLNVSLPATEVDVNVHPTKTEVKFRSEQMLFSSIRRVVRKALAEQAPVPEIGSSAKGALSSAGSQPSLIAVSDVGYREPTSLPTPTMSLPVLRILGQLDSSYIIAEGPEGLYLIDQHAAHERVLFEEIASKRAENKIEVQGLLEPATFEVSPRQAETLVLRYKDLGQFGFNIEPFGDKTFLVRAVPALLNGRDWVGCLRELLDSLSGDATGDWVEEVSKSLACHGAVRAGQVLTNEEMRELARSLEKADNPRSCPHGRPTMIHLSLSQLKREFGRTV